MARSTGIASQVNPRTQPSGVIPRQMRGSTSYSLSGSHPLAYGFRIPTTTKKVRISYIFRLQNAPAASTWGLSLWGADLQASGSTSSSTTTLRAETADITQSSTLIPYLSRDTGNGVRF